MYAIYRGDGQFINGIPARDLSQAEFEALPDGLQQAVVDSKLYEMRPGNENESGKRAAKKSGGK